MRPTGTQQRRRTPLTLSASLVLALLAALLLVGTAQAAVKPGRPTTKAPKNTIATTKPTFTWSKAARATRYEVRVYRGKKLVLKKTGLKKRSWKSSKALPQNVKLTWKVRGRNARGNGVWSRGRVFKVVLPSSAKALTAFSLPGLSPPVVGTIDENAHTVALTVPFGTNVTALVASFTSTGASVRVGGTAQVSGATANDFTRPVVYTVTAADGTTRDYAVTVTVAANPAKAITAFTIPGQVAATDIDESSHNIALTVPIGTPVTALVASFTTTGASVKVGGAAQVSGTTANDFTSPVVYTVTAADGTTQEYMVTVTGVVVHVGQSYGGGVIAYILVPGDPGYVAGQTRGLIAATADQSAGIRWYNGSNLTTGASGSALGTGFADTNTIIAVQGQPATSYAAGLARAYAGGGYTDWYLPSAIELYKLQLNKAAIGGFSDSTYWSSYETSANYGWAVYFGGSGIGFGDGKYEAYRVRPVRSFPADPAKAMTTFGFQGLTPAVTGAIDEASHTVALTVPFGTDVGSLVATFTTTGAWVTVGGVPQFSGVTANDFSNPVVYTVTAAEASTQAYTVTVTISDAVIGQSYGGGVIAYILQPGDPGYIAGDTHGLIAAAADQSTGIVWTDVAPSLVGTTRDALGAGQANTTAIVSQAGCSAGAAYLCDHLEVGVYDDWYLPSYDELVKLSSNRIAIGGFTSAPYWSSSEQSDYYAHVQFFDPDYPADGLKSAIIFRVRAVRSF